MALGRLLGDMVDLASSVRLSNGNCRKSSTRQAPVLAPGLIRRLYDEAGATRAIGLLGSLESLVPAFAPIVGVWLLTLGGWPVSFWVLAGLSAILAVALALAGAAFPGKTPPPSEGDMVESCDPRCLPDMP